MATGLFVACDGNVVVEFGNRKISIPPAQYKANGYRPPFERLAKEQEPGPALDAASVLKFRARRMN